ncbi:helix-turn-helix transcriptional regulator [Agromyces humatus]|uniref:Helix-turn-helix domain-containing protein n=1 Tax=Agromyces humatus TaxID=279573 RepID=A0ABN2KYT8_9MICO|nr:helix-turn-helix domain-containing protein [Agromyces humatus]
MSATLRSVDSLPELSTRPELSEFTGVAVSTLARWMTEGVGPKATKLGAHVRYRKADVLRWLDACAVEEAAGPA